MRLTETELEQTLTWLRYELTRKKDPVKRRHLEISIECVERVLKAAGVEELVEGMDRVRRSNE